jgi:digeranylgeranylglycerophospholipid reductase
VEKRPAIGSPVRCAEGIGREDLAAFVEPDPRWISAEIRRAELVAPDGTTLTLGSGIIGSKAGYVLDRRVFDRSLVAQAAGAGADVMVRTRAVAPIMTDGIVKGAVLEQGGIPKRVPAEVVIAADGVESRFSRWCGIDTGVPARDMMTCAQYLMTGLDIEDHTTVFCFGSEVAPEGYAWIFPKGKKSANVGVGISGRKSGDGHRARDYLERFVQARFPAGTCIGLVVGGVPVCSPLASTVAGGLMIVGDAARVADPLTGGGIFTAMFTGRLAARTAADAISHGDVSERALAAYDSGWRASPLGRELARNLQLREYFLLLSDKNMNALIRSVAGMNPGNINPLSVVKAMVKRNPLLVPELVLKRGLGR